MLSTTTYFISQGIIIVVALIGFAIAIFFGLKSDAIQSVLEADKCPEQATQSELHNKFQRYRDSEKVGGFILIAAFFISQIIIGLS